MSTHESLERFLTAQETTYSRALDELRAGKKRSHWMWFIFPQIKGLGHSERSQFYGIADINEARAYRQHPLLGERLEQATQAMLMHTNHQAVDILGTVDAVKFHSCMTLFSRVPDHNAVFVKALKQFFSSQEDPLTLQQLNQR